MLQLLNEQMTFCDLILKNQGQAINQTNFIITLSSFRALNTIGWVTGTASGCKNFCFKTPIKWMGYNPKHNVGMKSFGLSCEDAQKKDN